jgi:hypothetical protein
MNLKNYPKLKDINIFNHENLFQDYRNSLLFLGQLKEKNFHENSLIQYFHIYTDLKDPKEIESIRSFFATQNTNQCKLILWSDMVIDKNYLKSEIGELVDLITFKIYEPHLEAKDTPLENFYYLNVKDDKHWFQSDIFRILILYKYGGFFIDSDIILLRCFSPLYDLEFMYQWGGSNKKNIFESCATVLKLKNNSKNANLIINRLSKVKLARKGTTALGKDLFKRIKYDGNFQILPCAFFNIEWNIGLIDRKLTDNIKKTWFDHEIENDEYLFKDCFSWHWHGSSHRKKNVFPNSKFDKLKNINKKKIYEKFKNIF